VPAGEDAGAPVFDVEAWTIIAEVEGL